MVFAFVEILAILVRVVKRNRRKGEAPADMVGLESGLSFRALNSGTELCTNILVIFLYLVLRRTNLLSGCFIMRLSSSYKHVLCR